MIRHVRASSQAASTPRGGRARRRDDAGSLFGAARKPRSTSGFLRFTPLHRKYRIWRTPMHGGSIYQSPGSLLWLEVKPDRARSELRPTLAALGLECERLKQRKATKKKDGHTTECNQHPVALIRTFCECGEHARGSALVDRCGVRSPVPHRPLPFQRLPLFTFFHLRSTCAHHILSNTFQYFPLRGAQNTPSQ